MDNKYEILSRQQICKSRYGTEKNSIFIMFSILR